MKDKVKIGILGCADVARRHSIPAFQSLDNAEVVCIASRSYSKAKKWAEHFNIHAEKSYDVLLANKSIDAVYIPLPIGLHKEWALKAVRAGKHIICEKSLAGDLKSVIKIVNACRENKIILYENFTCDFHPQHRKVLSLIDAGAIGKPFIFRGYFGFPPFKKNNIRYDKTLEGGSLSDAGVYPVFMARKIFGGEPISVNCNLFYDKKDGVDIRGSAMLQFPDEKIALITFSYNSAYQNNYSLWGSRGFINLDRAYSISPDMKPDLRLVENDGVRDSEGSVDVPSANQFALIFSDFCDTVLNKKNRAGKIKDKYFKIISQARAVEALRVASKENRKVKLSEMPRAV